MIRTRNADQIISECRQIYFGATDPHQDGFTGWHCKKDLYRVKFAVDEMLAKTSRFTGEDEWLLEQEQDKMWKRLTSR